MNTPLPDSQADHIHSYMSCLSTYLLLYALLTWPNIYSVFSCIAILLAYQSSKIWVFGLVFLVALANPVACYFLKNSYILLNMLTYFPYDNNREKWQQVAGFCVPWAAFLVSYCLQYNHQKRHNYITPIGHLMMRIRAQREAMMMQPPPNQQ